MPALPPSQPAAEAHILNPGSARPSRHGLHILTVCGAHETASLEPCASMPLSAERQRRSAVSDLMVIGYPDEQTAEKAWAQLTRLQRDYLVDLEDAAIIRRDQKGRLHVTTPAHHSVAWGTLSGMFWGVVIGLLFLPLAPPVTPLFGVAGGLAGAGIGAAARLTIEDDFRQRVQDLVQPGTSALLVLIRKVTLDKFLEALRPCGGTVLRTSLPDGAEEQLMKVLHGEDPAAASWEQAPESAAARGSS